MPATIEARTGLQTWEAPVLTRRPPPEPLGKVVNESLSVMGKPTFEV
jgi:hypothetical protein